MSKRKVRSIISFVLLGLCILFVTVFVIKRIKNPNPTMFGLGSAIVLTGSMEPTIPVGSLIIVHAQSEYNEKDIVMFESDQFSSSVTHRIVEVTENGYITQGDANNTRDSEVPKDAVIGKVIFSIPHGRLVIVLFVILISTIIIVIPGPKEKD